MYILHYIHGGPTFDPVGRCSHVMLMHEKTLLIQRIKSVFLKVEANQKCSLPKANQNCFPKAKADQKRFSTRWQRIKCVFRRVVIFSKRNWAGSKAFSHASASRDYIGLLDQTLDPRVVGLSQNWPITVNFNCFGRNWSKMVHFGWFGPTLVIHYQPLLYNSSIILAGHFENRLFSYLHPIV